MFGFVITIFEALVFVTMSIAVYRARREDAVNRFFALFLACVALWLISGFVDRILTTPNVQFVTLQYRFAYAVAVIATGFFFLFSLGFYLGKRPKRIWVRGTMSVSILFAFICATDLVIKSAETNKSSYLVAKGPLYFLFILFFAVFGLGGLFLVTLKWRQSRSIDRARALYIIIGFGIFFFLAFILTILLPSFMSRDVTSDYTFMVMIIPAGFTAYAILKFQLLDVRLALRRAFSYLLTLVLFGLPVTVFYVSFRSLWSSQPALETAITVIILAMAIALTPAVRNLTEKAASRLLFTSMYSDMELLHQVSTIFTSTADIRDGIGQAANLICKELRLEKLIVVLPREMISGKEDWLVGSVRTSTGLTDFHTVELSPSPLYRLRRSPLIKDDIVTGSVSSKSDSEVLCEMEDKGFVALLPIAGTLGEVGMLMVGEKLKAAALDPVDLSFLQQFAERSGIFIENYLLSTYLLAQLEQSREAQKKVKELDRFKTDIINVTSHELRTPLTILKGYAYVLRDRCESFNPIERMDFVQNIIDSCDRLDAILEQFLTISRFQRKEVQISRQIMQLKELFDDVRVSLNSEEGSRVLSHTEPEDIVISSDRSYLLMLLKNLVDNAIRYSASTSPVIIAAKAEETGVRISVKDFGVGISPTEVRNIFNPFDRIEEADKHQPGTGLGLYIVRLIADMLGTEIDVESQPNQGAVFSFRLPLFGTTPKMTEPQA